MRDEIAVRILELCRQRGPDKTMCPSEIARALTSDEASWRALMPEVRLAARDLAQQVRIVVLQRGIPIDAPSARGPIRLGMPDTPAPC